MEKINVHTFYKRFIHNTEEKSVVVDKTLLIGKLTNAVRIAGSFPTYKVYITTKVIKHLYDRKPAEEFNFILKYLAVLIKFPDHIYENKGSKRGTLLFTKCIKSQLYMCSLEITNDRDPDEIDEGMNYVVTAFRLRKGKESYLDHYKLIWSWKGGVPSS